jgi:hypothetical protein
VSDAQLAIGIREVTFDGVQTDEQTIGNLLHFTAPPSFSADRQCVWNSRHSLSYHAIIFTKLQSITRVEVALKTLEAGLPTTSEETIGSSQYSK